MNQIPLVLPPASLEISSLIRLDDNSSQTVLEQELPILARPDEPGLRIILKNRWCVIVFVSVPGVFVVVSVAAVPATHLSQTTRKDLEAIPHW